VSGWFPFRVPVPGTDDWPCSLHDPQHTGRSADVLLPPLRLLWTWQNNHPFDLTKGYSETWNQLVSVGGRLLVSGGLNSNRLLALGEDRTRAWEADNGGYTESQSPFYGNNGLAVAGGQVLFTSTDYSYSVSLADGTISPPLDNTNGEPSGGATVMPNGDVYQQFVETDSGVNDLVLYHGLSSPLVEAAHYSVGNGTLNDVTFRVPAVDSGRVYASLLGSLCAFDAGTLGLLWTGPASSGTSPCASGGRVWVATDYGRFTALDGATGSVIWSVQVAGGLVPLVDPVAGVIYVGSSDGNLYALRASDGSVLWSALVGGPVGQQQQPALSGALLYAPVSDGVLRVFSTDTGRLVYSTQVSSRPIGPVTLGRGRLYVSDSAGVVYAYQPAAVR